MSQPADFTPATTLKEVSRAATLQPLAADDSRIGDATLGAATVVVRRLQRRLILLADDPDLAVSPVSKFLVTGHFGCGKTTELGRLAHGVSDRLHPLHVNRDGGLPADADLTIALVWVCDALLRDFCDRRLSLNSDLVEEVARWCADTTGVAIDDAELKAALKGSYTARLGGSWADVWGLKLFARVISEITGSPQRRCGIAAALQCFGSEWVGKVNLLLEAARQTLRTAGLPGQVLIILDDLDRLSDTAARGLIGMQGPLLRDLAAPVVVTAPMGVVMVPTAPQQDWGDVFVLPLIRVTDRHCGEPQAEGLAELRGLVARRVDVDAVFDGAEVLDEMCDQSGGCIRDLMRLLDAAAAHAEVVGKTRIDDAAVACAVRDLRNDYKRLLLPERIFLPRLAAIHATRGNGVAGVADAAPDVIRQERALFADLLSSGAVLAYDDDEPWYDVHPVVQRIRGFQHAIDAHKNGTCKNGCHSGRTSSP